MKAFRWLAVLTLLVLVPGTAWAQDWKLGVRITGAPGGGVRIVSVFMNSPASMIGLRPGHTILSIDGILVNDPFQVRDYIMSEDRASINLIYTDGFAFWQVDAEFGVVAAMVKGPLGTRVEKKLVLKKPVKRVRVADPRRK